jgi:murein DD-endopeptidase MepM/ murein hydrolase activator NlpD
MACRPYNSIVRRAVILAVAIGCCGVNPSASDAIHVTAPTHPGRQGDVVVLTATTEQPVDEVRARGFDRDLATFRVGPTTWQTLVGVDIDAKPGVYTVSFKALSPTGAITAVTGLTVTTRQFGRRVLTVDDAFVNPPEPVLARITREARDLEQLWTQSESRRLWTASFVRPVPGRVNGAFGSRSVFNGQARQPHGGADFLSPTATPIHAPNSGRVLLAHDLYFTGNTVVIDHGLGVFSLLAHLSLVSVREGDMVTRGEIIGQVGATGRVTGPHLHWAVRMNGARVDPVVVLEIVGQEPSADQPPAAR